MPWRSWSILRSPLSAAAMAAAPSEGPSNGKSSDPYPSKRNGGTAMAK